MTMYFTEEEEKYLVKELFNWHVKDGCPKKIADSINKKLKELKAFADEMNGGVGDARNVHEL